MKLIENLFAFVFGLTNELSQPNGALITFVSVFEFLKYFVHVYVIGTNKHFPDAGSQVLIATSTLAWGVNFPAHLVVIKGTEYFDGKTKRYVDFPITGKSMI